MRKLVLLVSFFLFQVYFSSAERAIGDSCSSHEFCNHGPGSVLNSRCSDIVDDNIEGTCECVDGYYGDNGDKECVRSTLSSKCKDKNNPFEFCSNGVQNSACDEKNDVCHCQMGFQPKDICGGLVTCAKVEVDTPCEDDAFCKLHIENSYCDKRSHCCACLGHLRYVPANDTCVKNMLNDATCEMCLKTNGVCWDSDKNGKADSCDCPRLQQASGDPMITGCDVQLFEVGSPCNEKDGQFCFGENVVCKEEMTIKGKVSNCACTEGYVKVLDPVGKVHRCYKVLNDDLNCEACEQNGGVCYDLNGDGVRDGCQCPRSMSSSNPDDPSTDCDTRHVAIDCQHDRMRIQYTPHSANKYSILGCDMDSKNLLVQLPENENDKCKFTKKDNVWTLDLVYEDDGLSCLISKANSATDSLLYMTKFQIQFNRYFQTAADLYFNVYCEYDTHVKLSTGASGVIETKGRVSEGEIIRPGISIFLTSNTGFDIGVVTLGGDVRLHIKMHNDRNMYVSMRPEVCMAATQADLDIPGTVTETLLIDNCPVGDVKGLKFFPQNGNLKHLVSTAFPIMKFNNAEFVFFHCTVRVCMSRNAEECKPAKCQVSRKRRSISDGITSLKRRLRADSDLMSVATKGIRVVETEMAPENIASEPINYNRRSMYSKPKRQPNVEKVEQIPQSGLPWYAIFASCLATVLVTLAAISAGIAYWAHKNSFTKGKVTVTSVIQTEKMVPDSDVEAVKDDKNEKD